MDGWLSPYFQSHRLDHLMGLNIRGYSSNEVPGSRQWWKFDLPPGWSHFVDKSLEEVCAFQWSEANQRVLGQKGLTVHYESLLGAEGIQSELNRILEFSGIQSDPSLVEGAAPVVMATGKPGPAKWLSRRDTILPVIQVGRDSKTGIEHGLRCRSLAGMGLMKAIALSAYQGRGWRARSSASQYEKSSKIWSISSVNSEYQKLREVLLYVPGSELKRIRTPNSVQHLSRIHSARISEELRQLAKVFRKEGIEVRWLDRQAFAARYFNLMYVRDLFWMTPEGAIIARNGQPDSGGRGKVRGKSIGGAGSSDFENDQRTRALRRRRRALGESRTVLCGLGNRTNCEGFRQLPKPSVSRASAASV